MNPASWTSAKPTAGGLLPDDYYSCLVAAEAASSQEQRYASAHGRGSDDLILPENYAGYLKSYSKPEKVEEPPPPAARGSGGSTANTRGIGAPSPLRERAGLERKRKRDQARQYKSKMRSKVRQMLKKQAHRRLGLWRSRVLDGDRVPIYVSLDGIAYPRGRDAYVTQERDQKALTRMSVSEFGPNSRIGNPRALPYCQQYPPLTPVDLRFWHLPPNIVEAYRLSSGITGLYTWQADCLSTLEKVNGMVNRLVSQADSSTSNVGTVIIDELHMVGDEQRGHILELILLKLMLFATGRVTSASSGELYQLQVVCMSATLPSLDPLKSWLLEADVYTTEFRPVPLEYFVKVGPRLHSGDLDRVVREIPLLQGDPDRITALVWEVAQEACSVGYDAASNATGVIVFCATKAWCEKTAVHVASTWPGVPWDLDDTMLRGRQQALDILRSCPAGLCPTLEKSIPKGVAYHHSGLTMEERRVIETAFRNGHIHTLCATSTLAAGVNLPARRVIIRSLQVGISPLDASRLRQMCGRAGRAGFAGSNKGEAILCVKDDREARTAKDLINAQLTGLSSRLTGDLLTRALLEIICLKLVSRVDEIPGRFCPRLLRYHLQPDQESREGLQSEVSTCLEELEKDRFVKVNDGLITSTPLGEAVAFSSLKIEEASVVFRALRHASSRILLSSDLHLLSLVTPVRHDIPVHLEAYLNLYNAMAPDQRAVADRCGISEGFLNSCARRNTLLSRSTPVPVCHRKSPEGARAWQRQLVTHLRFYATLLLHHLLKGVPLPMLASTYKVNCGQIQQLQSTSTAFCGMVVGFCDRLRWWALAAALTPLSEQLSTGAPSFVAEMTSKLSHVGLPVSWAIALHSAGLESVTAIAGSDTDTLHRILARAVAHQRGRPTQDFNNYLRETAKTIIVGAQEVVNAQVAEILEEADECRASDDEESDGSSSSSSSSPSTTSSGSGSRDRQGAVEELGGDANSLLDGLTPEEINSLAAA
ncbi:hypothetical protein FOZ60_008047 [Perkinsus olseni]|uniref:DNA polymerase theta n=1 Tax=Perkinsus olseni TaxID=32597 RepID=A0A7J6PED3_PEROL|nr:hypothetical protein FOZ60_008047 [Perkinsus olseni]